MWLRIGVSFNGIVKVGYMGSEREGDGIVCLLCRKGSGEDGQVAAGYSTVVGFSEFQGDGVCERRGCSG